MSTKLLLEPKYGKTINQWFIRKDETMVWFPTKKEAQKYAKIYCHEKQGKRNTD